MQSPHTRQRRLGLALILALPLTVLFASHWPSHADELSTADSVKLIAPLLDEQTFAVLRLRPHRLDVAGLLRDVGPLLAVLDDLRLDELQDGLTKYRQMLIQAGVSDLYILLDLDDLSAGKMPALAFTFAGKSEADSVTKIVTDKIGLNYKTTKQVGNLLLFGDAAQLRRLTAQRPANPLLATMLAATDDGSTAQLVMMMTQDQRRVINEMLPEMPRELGGASTKALTTGLNWLSLGVGTKGGLSLQMAMECKNESAAAEMAKFWGGLLDALGQLPMNKLFGGPAKADNKVRDLDPAGFDRLRKQLAGQVTGVRINSTVPSTPEFLKTFTKALLVQAREAAAAMMTMNHLRQIGIAMHNYHDSFGRFPQNITDKNGKALLSWRVAILPFIEQDPLFPLFKQFRLNEPWDSEHNKKLIAQMPKLYRSPESKAPPGKTRYLGAVTENSMFSPKLPKQGLRIADVSDGTSNTLWLIEVNDDFALEWTRPNDWEPGKEPLKALQNVSERGTAVLFVDGSIRRIQPTISERVLRALISRNGGEVIPNDY